jgi:hypothetical protein
MSTGERQTTPSGNGVYRTEYEPATHDSVSAAVADAVAAAKDIDPITGQFCLHDHLDPDALETLLASRETDLSLTFTIDAHRVTVDADGTVLIELT